MERLRRFSAWIRRAVCAAVAAWPLFGSGLYAQEALPPQGPGGVVSPADVAPAASSQGGYVLAYAASTIPPSQFLPRPPYKERISIPNGSEVVVGFPFTINDANVTGRVAAYADSTRMNPNVLGYFLPSAIPVKGDAYYGSSWRAGVISNGTGAGFNYSAPGTDLKGSVLVGIQASSTDTVTAIVPTATVSWKWLTVGAQDSTFTDVASLPESADLAGPIGRPTIRGSTGITTQPQIRVSLPASGDLLNGWFVNFAVEQPGADVLTPVVVPTGTGGVALTPINHYSTFSRLPDIVGKVYYQTGGTATNAWTGSPVAYAPFHLEFGVLLRDLGVEGDGKGVPSIRENTTGWGMQLSGRAEVPFLSDATPICGRHDYVMFGATYGEGIGHYFADLHMLNPVNDAAYNSTTGILSPLPVFAFYGAYQHAWTGTFHSTLAYSHIDLDSQAIPGNAASPYKLGDYFSVNLVWADDGTVGDFCIPKGSGSTASSSSPNCPNGTPYQVHLSAGAEYLFGERETLNGNFGADQRLMFFFALWH
jgi:hypothetical protein